MISAAKKFRPDGSTSGLAEEGAPARPASTYPPSSALNRLSVSSAAREILSAISRHQRVKSDGGLSMHPAVLPGSEPSPMIAVMTSTAFSNKFSPGAERSAAISSYEEASTGARAMDESTIAAVERAEGTRPNRCIPSGTIERFTRSI